MERPARRPKKVNSGIDSDGDNKVGRVKLKKQVPSKATNSKAVVIWGIVILISIGLFGYELLYSSYKTNIVNEIGSKIGLYENVFAIVIDAGSTGSRIYVPSFYKSIISGNLKLHDDLFVQNKRGLSSYADNPTEGAKKIAELLEEAKRYIPQSRWHSTPIALRATAGLRLLSQEKAEGILREVEAVIDASPFLSNKHSVAIMDGKDEGLFSWFTVNFLLDRLKGHLSKSVLTFDLGGGSVQITYVPHDSDKLLETEFVHPVKILNQQINTYSYSYLGLGLMSVRRDIFLMENDGDKINLTSSCVSPIVKGKSWKYGAERFYVSGRKENSQAINSKCYSMIKEIVKNGNVDKPVDIKDYEIVGISYFFDQPSQCGLIDPYNGGTMSIEELKKATRSHCTDANLKLPFMCLDLMFISVLLEEGFGLNSETKISLLDKIDGHEISWALGAGYFMLENGL